MKIDMNRPFIAVNIAVMTVSDTRTPETDKSGNILEKLIKEDGHNVVERTIVRDDQMSITEQLIRWRDREDIDVVISTGGTGITGRDVTPEAFESLYTKAIPGFGELFRMLSYELIGTSTIQSRATGGISETTLMFALPGSPGAARDGWNKILKFQLDNRHMPCNFVEIMPRFSEK